MALIRPCSHFIKHLTTKACLKMDISLEAKNPHYRNPYYEQRRNEKVMIYFTTGIIKESSKVSFPISLKVM